MEQFAYITLLKDARTAIAEARLSDALYAIAALLAERPDWEISEKLLTIEDAYKRMLAFMAQGGVDLQRESLYAQFLCQASELLNCLSQAFLLRQEGTYYYAVGQTLERMNVPKSVAECFQQSLSIRTLFEKVYTSAPWKAADRQKVKEYIEIAEAPLVATLLGGVTFALLTSFDIAKAEFLLQYAKDMRPLVRVRALVGAILSYIKDEKQWDLYPECRRTFRELLREPEVAMEVRKLQLQLFITSENKAVQKRLREEIMPTILETSKALRLQEGIDEKNIAESLSKLSANPEWERSGRLSKVSDSMRKIQELQQQGADVYMGSFAAMKRNIPFFNVAVNWFVPFFVDHPEVNAQGEEREFLLNLANVGMFSNSDKYSLAFLFRTLPEGQRKAVTEQLNVAFKTGELGGVEKEFEKELRIYLQDLYRFFTLFALPECKAVNPFSQDLLLSKSSLFAEVFNEQTILMELADLQFRQKNFNLANVLFQQAAVFEQKDAAVATELFQKWGFSSQSVDDFDGAIAAYEKVLLFSPEDQWTLKHLIRCYQKVGQLERALKIALQLLNLDEDNEQYLMLVAQVYMKQESYEQAHNLLLKCVYLEETVGEAVRALAWCELLQQRPEEALKQYQKLVGSETATDLVNAGHAAWQCGRVGEAMDYYKKFLGVSKKEALADCFKEDTKLLRQGGISDLDQKMMLDLLCMNDR